MTLTDTIAQLEQRGIDCSTIAITKTPDGREILGQSGDYYLVRTQCTCLRCGHTWIPKVPHPITCAKCRSPYWDKPRKGQA
jgi:predicted Zn-ribbon and HTH transcriptional regulator